MPIIKFKAWKASCKARKHNMAAIIAMSAEVAGDRMFRHDASCDYTILLASFVEDCNVWRPE